MILDRPLRHPLSSWYAEAVHKLTSAPNYPVRRLRVEAEDREDLPLWGWGAGPDLGFDLGDEHTPGIRVLSTVLCTALRVPSCCTSLRLYVDAIAAESGERGLCAIGWELTLILGHPLLRPRHLHLVEVRSADPWTSQPVMADEVLSVLTMVPSITATPPSVPIPFLPTSA